LIEEQWEDRGLQIKGFVLHVILLQLLYAKLNWEPFTNAGVIMMDLFYVKDVIVDILITQKTIQETIKNGIQLINIEE